MDQLLSYILQRCLDYSILSIYNAMQLQKDEIIRVVLENQIIENWNSQETKIESYQQILDKLYNPMKQLNYHYKYPSLITDIFEMAEAFIIFYRQIGFSMKSQKIQEQIKKNRSDVIFLLQEKILKYIMTQLIETQREYFIQSLENHLSFQLKSRFLENSFAQRYKNTQQKVNIDNQNSIYLNKHKLLSQEKQNDYQIKQKRLQQIKNIKQITFQNQQVLKIDHSTTKSLNNNPEEKIQRKNKNLNSFDLSAQFKKSQDQNNVKLIPIVPQMETQPEFTQVQTLKVKNYSVNEKMDLVYISSKNEIFNMRKQNNSKVFKQMILNNQQIRKQNQIYKSEKQAEKQEEEKKIQKSENKQFKQDFLTCRSQNIPQKTIIDLINEYSDLQKEQDILQTNKNNYEERYHRTYKTFTVPKKRVKQKTFYENKTKIIEPVKIEFLNFVMSDVKRQAYQKYLFNCKCISDLDMFETQRPKYNFPRFIKQYQDIQLYKNLVEENQFIKTSIIDYNSYFQQRKKQIQKQMKIRNIQIQLPQQPKRVKREPSMSQYNKKYQDGYLFENDINHQAINSFVNNQQTTFL